MIDANALAIALPNDTFPVMSGCVAFGTTLALSTMAQKAIGITTATKVIPSITGMLTVCAASLASQQMAIYTRACLKEKSVFTNPNKGRNLMSSSPFEDKWDMGIFGKLPAHNLRV